LRRLLGLLFAAFREQALKEIKLMDALELLKQDHQKVKGLFKETEGAENSRKKQLFNQIDTELEIHAHIEETVFYAGPFPFTLDDDRLSGGDLSFGFDR